jgi:hypothetical protein
MNCYECGGQVTWVVCHGCQGAGQVRVPDTKPQQVGRCPECAGVQGVWICERCYAVHDGDAPAQPISPMVRARAGAPGPRGSARHSEVVMRGAYHG